MTKQEEEAFEQRLIISSPLIGPDALKTDALYIGGVVTHLRGGYAILRIDTNAKALNYAAISMQALAPSDAEFIKQRIAESRVVECDVHVKDNRVTGISMCRLRYPGEELPHVLQAMQAQAAAQDMLDTLKSKKPVEPNKYTAYGLPSIPSPGWLMPYKDLAHKLGQAARELNQATDLFMGEIGKLEGSLKKLNLGVTAWVVIQTTQSKELSIGYAKIGSRWGLGFREKAGQETTYTLFADAPRWMRLDGATAKHLEELLRVITTTANEYTTQITEAQQTLQSYLDLSDPADGTSTV